MPKMLRVLVVDDEPFVRLMAADAVGDAGHDPIEASDADEALALLEADPAIDVLFTDVKMPGSMDGLALAAMVQRRWPAIGIIVTSGHMILPDMPPDLPFLPKPYRTTTLAAQLAAFAG